MSPLPPPGTRQVGKTTLLLDIASELGPAAIYAAADSPASALPGFWDRIWSVAEDTARTHGRAVVLLDEVHLVPDWAARLKGQWDRLRRHRLAIHAVATGSSSLRLAPGDAALTAVRWGSYPGAVELRHDVERWTAYVRDAILEPAIGRDLLALGPIRKPGLLWQVFGVAAGSPAQVVSLAKIQGQLQDPGALETIAHYLQLLEDAFLVAALQKHAARQVRQRAAPPKLVTLNNALLTVLHPQGAPDQAADPARFGAWVENACLAHAWNAGQRVCYWREEPLEVDGVLDGSWGKWAVEVKTGHIEPTRLRGLSEFVRRFPDYRPLVICDQSGRSTARRLGFPTQLWREFLLDGPSSSG